MVSEIADQIAGGNGAIVGVMMESFLVAGRQDLESDGDLIYGQSITDACMDWDTTVLTLDRLASAVRKRREAADAMKIAVLGVGLIGGSIGLAARARLDAEVTASMPDRELLDRAIELDAIDSAHDSVASAVEGAELVFCAAPVLALPGLAAEALDAAGAGLRGDRRRLREARRDRGAGIRRAASSAVTRSPGRRPPASRALALTSSRARAGT